MRLYNTISHHEGVNDDVMPICIWKHALYARARARKFINITHPGGVVRKYSKKNRYMRGACT